MTNDPFRKFQKEECLNGGKREHLYGCPCCRKHKDLNEHKKYSRKRARVKLKEMDKKEFTEV